MRTAEELGITQQEYEALLAVRDGLASGALVHELDYSSCPGARRFNMETTGKYSPDCGTVACIGGWMYAAMHNNEITESDFGRLSPAVERQANYVSSSSPMGRLFYPPVTYDYHTITTEQAVKAIDNFVEHGDPHWSLVMEGETP